MKITAKLETREGRVISEAKPLEHELMPTVIKVPIIVGRFRRRRLFVVVRIEP